MEKFFQSLRILPRWMVIVLDLGVLAVSLLLAYFLRFNFSLDFLALPTLPAAFGIFLSVHLVTSLVTRSFSGIIRYTGIQDLVRLLRTSSIAAGIVLAIYLIWLQAFGEAIIPLSVLAIAYFVGNALLYGYRLAVKFVFSYYNDAISRKVQSMIFGAGSLGMITKQVIDSDQTSHTKIVGFLDDDPHKRGKVVGGTKIYSARSEDLASLFGRLGVQEVIIGAQKMSRQRKYEIVEECLKLGVQVKHVPETASWFQGELSFAQIKNVKIEDLLGRESIELDIEQVQQALKGRRVLVTGAAGSIGGGICRQVLGYEPEKLIMVDQAETPLYDLEKELEEAGNPESFVAVVGDVTNRSRMERIFGKYQPEVIFHAAAYKHVPMMEEHPAEAVLANVLGTKNVADLAAQFGVDKFVMISTDKAVNPTNVMGASKRLSELYLNVIESQLAKKGASGRTKFIVTRFGNVLGSNGSVIPLFRKQILAGGPVTVTHPEITRYFMTIPEACQLVLEAGAMGQGGEIFLFDMGKSVKILDLARKMIALSGLELGVDIDIKFTGCRQGEKLYEELLTKKEDTLETHHPKIMIAKAEQHDEQFLQSAIEQLLVLANTGNDFDLVRQMKLIVPEYKSSYSRFEVIDRQLSEGRHRPKSASSSAA